MATIYDLKPAFQRLLRGPSDALARAGVTANQVTVVALLLSIGTGLLLYLFPLESWALALVPAVLFLRMALNAIDGMLAREHDMKTRLGAVLNELGDVISDAALYLPFAVIPGVPGRWVVLVVVVGILTEMAGVVSVQIGGSRRYDGPFGKSDRAFVFGIVGLALGLGFRGFLWINLLMALVAALLLVTIFNRARRSLT